MACLYKLVILLVFVCQLHICESQGRDQMIEFTIQEEVPEHTLIGNVAASLRLVDNNDDTEFGLLSPTAANMEYFNLNRLSGDLRTVGRLDRELICPRSQSCDLSVDVTVATLSGEFQIVKVMVTVDDINDNKPTFGELERHVVYISEAAAVGTRFTLPAADDADSAANGIASYRLLSASPEAAQVEDFSLSVAGEDLALVVARPLDRESRAGYQLALSVTDGNRGAGAAQLPISVHILDVNDNAPVFSRQQYAVTVHETSGPAPNAPILVVSATDPDAGANGQVTYTFSRKTASSGAGRLFHLHPSSGALSLAAPLTFHPHRPQMELVVTATDAGASKLASSALVLVTVADTNDHAPQITVSPRYSGTSAPPNPATAWVPENAGISAFVAHVSVTDPDGGDNGKFTCSLDNQDFDLVEIYETEYKLVTTVDFDREEKEEYSVNIVCEDQGTPRQSSRHELKVLVQDENDHSPVFSQTEYSASVAENGAIGQSVATVAAADADAAANADVSYSLSHSHFSVAPKTGVISVLAPLDRERRPLWRLPLVATDAGAPPRSATATVVVTVTDVDDNVPRFPQPSLTFTVRENAGAGAVVGTVTAHDADSAGANSDVRYSLLSDDDAAFSLNQDSGVLTTARRLDREYKHTYTLTVMASSPGNSNHGDEATVTVLVTDDNDNAPEILPHPSIIQAPASMSVGDTVTYIRARDADTGVNAQLRYSLVGVATPGLFAVNTLTGALTLSSPPSEHVDQTIVVTVSVRDSGSPPHTTTAQLTVHINGTAVPAPRGGSPPQGAADTSLVVIILLTVTALVSLALIVTIVVLIRRRRRQQQQHEKSPPGYHCHISPSTSTPDSGVGDMGCDHPSKHHLYPPLADSDIIGIIYDPLALSTHAPPTSHTRRVTFDPLPRDNQCDLVKGTQVKQTNRQTLTQSHLQAHEMHHSPASDVDSDRGSSDSGRGASEEEANNSHDSLPPTSPRKPPAGQHRNQQPPAGQHRNQQPPAGQHRNHNKTDSFKERRSKNKPYNERPTNSQLETFTGGKDTSAQEVVPPPPCKVHGYNRYQPDYFLDTSADVDGLSDGGSSTSGEYVIELEDFHNEPVISKDVYV